MATLELVACMSQNHVIGLNGTMPWHLSADLKHFKEITMGHAILMGSTTFKSIGRVLPGRRNIVLSTSNDFNVDNLEVVHSLDEATALLGDDILMVIGGGKVYQETIEKASKLHLTIIEKDFEGDTYFPKFDGFKCIDSVRHQSDEGFFYRFETYERI